MENFDDVSGEEEEDVKPQIFHEKARVNQEDVRAKQRKRIEHQKGRDLRTTLNKLRKR